MSVQRGNYKKKGQKYQNSTSYKNNLYDTSHQTKALNNMVVSEVCGRCTAQIQWKIKYKKYKPLTQPRRCTRCQQKTVKKAYLIMCSKCAKDNNICAKCGEKSGIVNQATLSPAELASRRSKMDAEMRFLSERERRTILRNQRKGGAKQDERNGENASESDEDSHAETSSEEDERSTECVSNSVTVNKLENLEISGCDNLSEEGGGEPS